MHCEQRPVYITMKGPFQNHCWIPDLKAFLIPHETSYGSLAESLNDFRGNSSKLLVGSSSHSWWNHSKILTVSAYRLQVKALNDSGWKYSRIPVAVGGVDRHQTVRRSVQSACSGIVDITKYIQIQNTIQNTLQNKYKTQCKTIQQYIDRRHTTWPRRDCQRSHLMETPQDQAELTRIDLSHFSRTYTYWLVQHKGRKATSISADLCGRQD